MRNRWGIEIKKGYHAWAKYGIRGSRNDERIEGPVTRIDKTSDYAKAYGPQVTIKVNARGDEIEVHADDVYQVLPPMRITRGGVVKANPDSIHIDIDSHNTKGRNVRAKNPIETAPLNVPAYAARDNGNGKRLWYVEDVPRGSRGGVHAMDWSYTDDFDNAMILSPHWQKRFASNCALVGVRCLFLEADKARDENPTPRLTRYDQPSQRERISERTGRPTKTPSARLKNRRLKTHHFAPEGVWANPLTRVKLKSPAQRGGEVPEKGSRLYKRRQTTAKAPAGFYANPLETRVKFGDALADAAAPDTMRDNGEYFFVQWKNEGERKWTTQKIFDTYAEAEKYAKAWHRQVPSIYIRVVNKSPATGREKYAHHLR